MTFSLSSFSPITTTYGIFFAYGKNIKSGYLIKDVSVIDILPTIFVTFDVPVSNNIDGKLLDEIFIEKSSLKIVDWKSYSLDGQILSENELEKINKLKGMFKAD